VQLMKRELQFAAYKLWSQSSKGTKCKAARGGTKGLNRGVPASRVQKPRFAESVNPRAAISSSCVLAPTSASDVFDFQQHLLQSSLPLSAMSDGASLGSLRRFPAHHALRTTRPLHYIDGAQFLA
jgi:hypothetical protein